MGFLAQELSNEEKQMTIADFFAENYWSKELVRAMDDLGIHELDSAKKMGVLSGGERFKYRFLSLLAKKPDLILRYMCLAVNKSSTFHWKYCK
ncbi:hypothetical protein [Brevibacillus brevis]|uniref:hypothetical protein n=1 Tax=Brevibacillus brevis TaxID=1393 RepID=UPI00064E707D|nr:hypothetical protein [Brevibacillus brevis]